MCYLTVTHSSLKKTYNYDKINYLTTILTFLPRESAFHGCNVYCWGCFQNARRITRRGTTRTLPCQLGQHRCQIPVTRILRITTRHGYWGSREITYILLRLTNVFKGYQMIQTRKFWRVISNVLRRHRCRQNCFAGGIGVVECTCDRWKQIWGFRWFRRAQRPLFRWCWKRRMLSSSSILCITTEWAWTRFYCSVCCEM